MMKILASRTLFPIVVSMGIWARLLTGDRALQYEALSFILVLYTFYALFPADREHNTALEVYYWLSALSSGWAAHIALTSFSSVLISRSPLMNLDAHDAFAYCFFARNRCPSVFLLCQSFFRHLTIATNGRVLTPQVCRAVRDFLQRPNVGPWLHWLDMFTLCELVFDIVFYQNLAALICFSVYFLVLSTFRYVASAQYRDRWRELYSLMENRWKQANGEGASRWRVVLDLANAVAFWCEHLWPTGKFKVKAL
jgi:hypothetical protein